MYRGSSFRFLPLIIVVVVVAIIVIIFVSIGRLIFGGGESAQTNNETVQALLDSSPGRSVRMHIRGPLVASEDSHSSQVDVSPGNRRVTLYSGYSGQVTATEQYDNSVGAYQELVYALYRANLANGAQLQSTQDDTRGVCATGNLYEFDILSGGTVTQRFWATSCGGAGSLRADLTQLRILFDRQIPIQSRLQAQIEL